MATTRPLSRRVKRSSGVTCADSIAWDIENAAVWQQLGAETRATHGVVFTPAWLAKSVVSQAIDYWKTLNRGTPKIALDTSCGTGIFLAELRCQLKTTKIIGIEKSPDFAELAKSNLSGFKGIEIHCADTLQSRQTSPDLFAERKFPLADLIVGNPPYVRSQNLPPGYAERLRKVYPEHTSGNFDLVTLFIAHALENLSPGGVLALVVSNKFMSSRYGASVCREICRNFRVLEIDDFGDGQVFPGRTTYTTCIYIAKCSASESLRYVSYPPGIHWDFSGDDKKHARSEMISSKCLSSFPWRLQGENSQKVSRRLISNKTFAISDVFPKIVQALRTGDNYRYVVDGAVAQQLDTTALRKCVSGRDIRRCAIAWQGKYLIWPYETDDHNQLRLISAGEFTERFPATARHLGVENSNTQIGFSRGQSLDCQLVPKLLMKELMSKAEFSPDCDGTYSFLTGYALMPHGSVSAKELCAWSAILCTPAMEYQLRGLGTHLHSGWFRLMKHHLLSVRLPNPSAQLLECAYLAATELQSGGAEHLHDLDSLVAQQLGLTKKDRALITKALGDAHAVSNPKTSPTTAGNRKST